MDKFELVSNYQMSLAQSNACASLYQGLIEGKKHQVLLGVTGSGKTFTASNLIAQINKPTLVLVHNKTLAAQLYLEFKEFFPHNHVEYFVSNFDFYQPEAYVVASDTYIDKSSSSNQELEMLRMSAINSLLNYRDTIVVASVACIYGASNPENYKDMLFSLKVGEKITRSQILKQLVKLQYTRNELAFTNGCFRVRGDNIEVYLAYRNKTIVRIELFDDEVESIKEVEDLSFKTLDKFELYNFFPANFYTSTSDNLKRACSEIEAELQERLAYFNSNNKLLEAQRLSERVSKDVEMLRETGICPGIENYARFIDGRKQGETPYTLFDYLPQDYLLLVDESHQSLPQIRAMYNGDRSRKETLVEYGFRLPSALDNRPLRFEEFNQRLNQVVFISATPGDYELSLSENNVEQIIRPTGLLDPEIEVISNENLTDKLIKIIESAPEQVIITTTSTADSESLSKFLDSMMIPSRWIHHEVKTIERSQILTDFRLKKFKVLIGINLLREGIDIPEVSTIVILNAEAEGIFRSVPSLIQMIGRAARNVNGKVYMMADKISRSMELAIKETKRRREIQMEFNAKYNITPQSIVKKVTEAVHVKAKKKISKYKDLATLEQEMYQAAENLDFELAAKLRDEIRSRKGEL